MTDETILTLAADIVASHVSHNNVSIGDLPGLIESVVHTLSGLGQDVVVVEEALVPAVSVRASVKSDALTCLECGERMKMLKRHLQSDHGMNPAEYRKRWNLPASYPMVAPEYSARRAALAVSIGLGRKRKISELTVEMSKPVLRKKSK